MPLILPYTIVFCLILFEAAGGTVFYIRRRDWKYQEKRIRELAAYLQAADSGKAVLLTRDVYKRQVYTSIHAIPL